MKKGTSFIVALAVLSLTMGAALAAPPRQGTGGQVYVVLKDDWLSKIAEKYYGDKLAYPRIVEATNAKAAQDSSFAVIVNPDLIEVGQKLWIPEAPSAVGGLSLDALRNATYQGIYTQPVPLTDGKYEGKPFQEGGASRPTVVFADSFAAFGDLNGDGIADAAVILVENSGGSGSFLYLAAVIDENGRPANVATTLLGDRVQPASISIQGGEIVFQGATHAPDDPMCCPSLKTTMTYRLKAGALVPSTP
jgi:LysM repeat protein